MSLLTICKGLAKNVGMEVPDVIISSTFREWAEAVEMSQAAGEELARRVDWGALSKSYTINGTGTNVEHQIPAGFSRINKGIGVLAPNITRPLTKDEWTNLEEKEGVPRYFLLQGDKISFWPYLQAGGSATVTYQDKYWISGGTNKWVSDDQLSLIDEDLLLKCLIVRWRRQKGMDYADYEAEYEASLADFAEFDERSRL